jgi:MerR family mercuric resistance operon transcriptional regulator
MKDLNFTIGKLAKASGVTVETVRFYEQKGLIQQPLTNSGYRKYPVDDVVKIKFIKRTQELGFTLAEAKDLLELRVKVTAKCGQVRKKAESKLQEVEAKIKDLKRMKRSLAKMVSTCTNNEKSTSECPILECFEKDVKC